MLAGAIVHAPRVRAGQRSALRSRRTLRPIRRGGEAHAYSPPGASLRLGRAASPTTDTCCVTARQPLARPRGCRARKGGLVGASGASRRWAPLAWSEPAGAKCGQLAASRRTTVHGCAVHAAGTANHPARSGPAGAMALRVALAVLAALAFAPPPVQSGATGAPNILFLLTDGAHHRALRAPARVPRAVCWCWPCMHALQRRLRCRCSAPGTDPEQLSSVHSARALGRAAATRAHI